MHCRWCSSCCLIIAWMRVIPNADKRSTRATNRHHLHMHCSIAYARGREYIIIATFPTTQPNMWLSSLGYDNTFSCRGWDTQRWEEVLRTNRVCACACGWKFRTSHHVCRNCWWTYVGYCAWDLRSSFAGMVSYQEPWLWPVSERMHHAWPCYTAVSSCSISRNRYPITF